MVTHIVGGVEEIAADEDTQQQVHLGGGGTLVLLGHGKAFFRGE